MAIVSIIDIGAMSVAVSARPILPSTISTSGIRASAASRCWRICFACAVPTPGKSEGMSITLPSFSGGMNSLPSRVHGTIDTSSTATATPIVVHRKRSTSSMTGRYTRMRNRLTGFAASGLTLPRMKSPIMTGTSVIDSSAAAAIESVFVQASGLKSRPSCASSAKTGRKDSVMMSSETKSAGPTSFDESTTSSHRVRVPPSRSFRSMCLWRFSTITMAASIIAPMAMAIPPRLMMLALSPSTCIARRAMRIPIGSVRIATSELDA